MLSLCSLLVSITILQDMIEWSTFSFEDWNESETSEFGLRPHGVITKNNVMSMTLFWTVLTNNVTSSCDSL